MNVIHLLSSKDSPIEMVGAKAQNLGKMLGKGLPVPPGFVITAKAFQTFIQSNQIEMSSFVFSIEEEFIQLPFPEFLEKEIHDYYQELMRESVYAVAVRSSSAFEDLSGASFAGQYGTFLNIQGLENLFIHVKRCWYSYFSPMVQLYAAEKAISLESLQMGVLVQGMVDADVSGVIFSKNPVTNNANEIMINASYGLGEGVVSGLVTPDLFIFQKDTGEWTKELGMKEVKIVPGPLGTLEMETGERERSSFCLVEDQLDGLKEITFKIEQDHQGPADIEFAFCKGKFHLLQVRPITT